ncbi:MAG: hypothetical protein ACRD21_18100, partial [Vicinamibacteria bacterium]
LLEVPRDGRYAIEVVCDDSCEIELGEVVLRAEGALGREIELARGEIPISIRYRQGSGPARLTVRWDTPAAFEPLPIDYFVRSRDGEKRSRIGANLALAALGSWWIAFPFYLRDLGRARKRWKKSALFPATIASLLILYGAVLRFEALLAHSDLPSRGERAASIHESLLAWVPSWGLFNPENAPEDPYRADVRSYLDRAQAMGREGFYAPSFREPFYVLLVRGFVGLAGGEIGVLIGSTVFSVLTLAIFYFVAKRMHGPWWAAGLLVPVTLHQWLVLDAPTGYRESTYSFFLLALVGAVALGATSARWAAVGGLLGGLLCLIRLSALSIVVPLLAVRAFPLPARERARYTSAFALVVLLLVVPFLWSNYRAHGDPLHSVSFHTEFWLRAEGLDSSQGPVSISRYFSDSERAGSVVKGTLLGLTLLPLRTFRNGLRDFPLLGFPALGLGVAGLLLVRRGANRYLAAAYFGHLIAFAYIQNFPSGEMPRFVMPAFFLLVLAIPAAITKNRIRELTQRRRGAETRERSSDIC